MAIKELIYNTIEDVKNSSSTDWPNSTYERFWNPEIDQRGQVGELLCVEVLKSFGCTVKYEKDETKEDKQWDLISDGMKLEVKLACRGKRNKTFQHENLDKTRWFDGIIIIDIAPEKIYLSCIAKKDLNWKKMHRRKDSTFYKYDYTEKTLAANNMAIKTTEDFYQKYLEMKQRINEA